jgi:hypothetical protein
MGELLGPHRDGANAGSHTDKYSPKESRSEQHTPDGVAAVAARLAGAATVVALMAFGMLG